MASSPLSEANALYSDVSSGGSNISDKRTKLVRAHEIYIGVLESSSTSEERASCCNNLGALNFLWSQVELETAPSWTAVATDTFAACCSHLRKSVRAYLSAKVEGERAKNPEEWLKKVEACLRSIVDWTTEQSRILGIADGAIFRNVCDEFDGAISKGNLKSEAGVVADLELARTLLDYHRKRNSNSNFIRVVTKQNSTETTSAVVTVGERQVINFPGEIRQLLSRAEAQLKDGDYWNAEELEEKLCDLRETFSARFQILKALPRTVAVSFQRRRRCCGIC